jgi:hypothetical protein
MALVGLILNQSRSGCQTWAWFLVAMNTKEGPKLPTNSLGQQDPEADLRPTTIGPYEVHPYANRFPMMTGGQFQDFLKDIEEHGQQKDVVLLEGKLLEGRNRALALHQLGKELKTVNFDELGTSQTPLEYVISSNLHRRHLTDQQRVQIAKDLAKLLEEQATETTQQTQAGIPLPDLGKPNKSGNAVPLYKNQNQTGRGKKGTASIAAARMGVSKQAVNQALARDAARIRHREQIASKICDDESLEKFFEKLDQGEILTGPSDLKVFAELPRHRMQKLLKHVLKTATFRAAQDREEEEDSKAQASASSKDKQSTDSQPERPEEELQAIERIVRLCSAGDPEVEASWRRALSKVHSDDLLDWNREPDENVPKVARLIHGNRGTGLRTAIRIVDRTIDSKTRLEDLYDHCIADGGRLEHVEGPFRIVVDRGPAFDREQVKERLCDIVEGTPEHEPIKDALEQNKWKLTDRELATLDSLGKPLLKKILPCLLYGVQSKEAEISFEESVT